MFTAMAKAYRSVIGQIITHTQKKGTEVINFLPTYFLFYKYKYDLLALVSSGSFVVYLSSFYKAKKVNESK